MFPRSLSIARIVKANIGQILCSELVLDWNVLLIRVHRGFTNEFVDLGQTVGSVASLLNNSGLNSALVEYRLHFPVAHWELSDCVVIVLFIIGHVFKLINLGQDLAHKGVLEILNETGVGHVLEVLLEAELLRLLHILRIDVQLLVVAHESFTFLAEGARLLLEVAAQLDQIEDRDVAPTTHTDELENECPHG